MQVESSWSRALRDLPDWLHEKATHPAPPPPAGPAAAPGVPHGDRPARELHAAEVSAAGSFYHLLKSLADDAEEEPRAPPAAAAPTAPPDQAAGMRSNITAPAAAAGIVREGSEDEDAVMGLFWAHAMGYVALLEGTCGATRRSRAAADLGGARAELSEQDPVFYFSKHRVRHCFDWECCTLTPTSRYVASHHGASRTEPADAARVTVFPLQRYGRQCHAAQVSLRRPLRRLCVTCTLPPRRAAATTAARAPCGCGCCWRTCWASTPSC